MRSVIGIRSVIGEGCQIANTIVMGADFVETAADLARNAAQGIPNVGIGAHNRIAGAIIDKNARIGERVSITNREGAREAARHKYYIRDGIVVVAKDAVITAGTEI